MPLDMRYDICVMNNHNINITNIHFMKQGNFCGYILVSATPNMLMSSRDVSNMILK